jgi:hypothetical protein
VAAITPRTDLLYELIEVVGRLDRFEITTYELIEVVGRLDRFEILNRKSVMRFIVRN